MAALEVITLSSQGGVPDARQIVDAAIGAASTALTSPSASFTAGDVGRTIVVAGAGAGGAKLTTTIAAFVSASQVTLGTAAATAVSGVGATWGTDCSAALQSAIDAAAAAHGGVIEIDGPYLLIGGVSKNFNGVANGVRIIGTGSDSALYVCCPPNQAAITIANAQQLSLESFYLIGTPNEPVDALQTLHLETSWVVIRECGFFGLASTQDPGGAIILAERSYLTLEDSHFGGCTANSFLGRSVVINTNWGGFASKRNRYIDIGTFNGIVHNKLAGLSISPLAWVFLGAVNSFPTVQENALTHSVARFEDDRMDEFALRCIVANSAGEIIPHVLVDGVRFNVPRFNNPPGAAIQAVNVESVEIRRAYFGYVQTQQSPVILQNCSRVLIDRCRNNEFATGLVATSIQSLTLRDSPGFLDGALNLTAVTNFVRIDNGVGGVAPLPVTGAIDDADFPAPPPVGTLGVDSSTGDIYAKTSVSGGWVRHPAGGRVLLTRTISPVGGSGVAAGATRNLLIPGVDCLNNPVLVSAYGGGENNADDAFRVSFKIVSRTTTGCTVTLINDGAATQTLSADIVVIASL